MLLAAAPVWPLADGPAQAQDEATLLSDLPLEDCVNQRPHLPRHAEATFGGQA